MLGCVVVEDIKIYWSSPFIILPAILPRPLSVLFLDFQNLLERKVDTRYRV